MDASKIPGIPESDPSKDRGSIDGIQGLDESNSRFVNFSTYETIFGVPVFKLVHGLP